VGSGEFRKGEAGCAVQVDSQQTHSFYVGKNAPGRKAGIMENRIVTVEV
jgi:hypothetical protein